MGHYESTVVIKKNGSQFANERKREIDFINNPESMPIGISNAKLKSKRKQMIQLALRKKLENQLIFR